MEWITNSKVKYIEVFIHYITKYARFTYNYDSVIDRENQTITITYIVEETQEPNEYVITTEQQYDKFTTSPRTYLNE